MKLAVTLLGCAVLCLSACVTKTINSDGTLQSPLVDKAKLADTYIDLAIEYQQHDAPQVALNRVNLAVETAPDNPKAYMVRAMIYQQLNQLEQAEADFRRALEIKPQYSEAKVNYAVFLCSEQRFSEADAYFSAALDNPLYYTPEMAYYGRGNCYFKQGNYAAANGDFLKLFTFRSPPAASYIAMARLQFLQKNYLLAYSYINKYTGSPTSASLWLKIQILQALLDAGPEPAKISEYRASQNSLGQILTKKYTETPEAQLYRLKYGSAAEEFK